VAAVVLKRSARHKKEYPNPFAPASRPLGAGFPVYPEAGSMDGCEPSMTTRRTLIRSLGAATAVGLAGCTSGDGGDGDTGGDGGGGGDGGSDGGDGGSGGDGWTQTDTVDMTDELAFDPPKVEVEAGTTLTFENVGSIGHTVTAYEDKIPDGATYFASGGYDSESAAVEAYNNEQGGNIPKGETYEVTLETTGTYEYYCVPHEMNGMVGEIKVI
jgi:plastocyanin